MDRAGKTGLFIIENRTKYIEKISLPMIVRNSLIVDNFKFEAVDSFTYLGSVTNSDNNPSEEIKSRIQKGSRCYFTYQYLCRNKLIPKDIKLKLYNTILRPVVTYDCETWTLSQKDLNNMEIFEGKILRKIYGPIMNDNGFQIRTNRELKILVKK